MPLKRAIPGAFTFDSYFTSAKVLNHIQSKQRAYVGDLKLNRKVVYAGREQKLQDVARQIPWEAKKPVRMGSRRYWYFSKQMRIPDVTHPVRIVLFWRERDDQEASKALVSNRLGWEVIRMVLVYRHRWTGTETFHRDGKQQLGLGDCQVRSGEGQTRHVYLVSAAYSLLMRSLQQSPCAGLGSADADDHRRSLSCRESRDLGAHDRLDCGQAHGGSLVHCRD